MFECRRLRKLRVCTRHARTRARTLLVARWLTGSLDGSVFRLAWSARRYRRVCRKPLYDGRTVRSDRSRACHDVIVPISRCTMVGQ